MLSSHLNSTSLDAREDPREGVCPPPLKDVLHQLLPNLSCYESAIDLLPPLIGGVVLALVWTDNEARPRVPMLLYALSVTHLIRIVTTRVTILPSPICTASFRKPRAAGGCYDCIFSGHTSTTLLLSYFVYRYVPRWRWPLLAYCLAASLMIVATRSHYTIDVLVAWVVSYAVVRTLDAEDTAQ